jgi:hypothetical protein
MLFMGMSTAYMGLFLGDPEYPDFWSVTNQAHNWLGPNPDDVYYSAPLVGNGVYKISGFRGTVRLVDIQIGSGTFFSRGTGAGTLGPNVGNPDFDHLHFRKDGYFEVVLSQERPPGYKGDWWRLDQKAAYIFVRQISYDWLHEVDGRFAIERLDRAAIKPRSNAQTIEANLRQIARWTENWTKFAADHINNLRAKGLINKLEVFDLSGFGGVTTQRYIEGAFELNPGEALIYETEVPKQCRYWNIQLNDALWSTIEYMNRQTSLNGYTARLDKDGKFRAVISAADPGVPNWLDTAGYATGTLDGRWTKCSSTPTPTLTKIKLADVRKYLPADTPTVSDAERDTAIRLRRQGAQLRRRW